MQNQIQLNIIDNQPVISTLIVAENTNRKHKDIMNLIRTHNSCLEEFGRVLFQTAPLETNGGVQNITFCELNEQQTTFLMTLLSNKGNIIEFKKNLVKAFFMMKEKLSGQLQTQGLPFSLEDIKRACIEAVKDEFLETKYIIKDELKATRSIINDVMANVIAENQNFLDEAKSVVSTKSLTAEQLDILKTRIENKAKELSTSKKIRYEIAIKTIYSDLNSYYGIKSWYHLMQGDYDEALFVINNVSLDRGA
jgi:phage regulator Rha-like protein